MKIRDITKLPLLLIGLMFIVGAVFYPDLPSKIPTHWAYNGQVDAWADKSFLAVFATPLASLGVYILFLLFPLVDPKRRNFEKFTKTYNILVNIVTAFFTVPFILMLATSLDKSFDATKSEKVFMIATSLLLIVVGNYMGKVKQNWLVGLRTPWTLSNEVVWNKSNRFAGKLMVAVGIIGIIGAFLPVPYVGIVFISLLILAAVVSVIYSYVIFREENTSS